MGKLKSLTTFYENHIFIQFYLSKFIVVFICEPNVSVQLIMELNLKESINNLYF